MMHQNFSIFSINKTQGHCNLNELLSVALYNDNLKMFNQAWEETSLALGNNLDAGVLENLYEKQMRKSTPMKNERF